MQLDFFRQLAARLLPQPSPPPGPASSPTPSVSSPRSKSGRDPLLEQNARDLLAPLDCPVLAEKVQVVWNSRMRSTAGTAYAARALISLNPRLRDFGPEEVDRTLRHELAHLLAHHRAGRRRIDPHGPEWRKACRDLGLKDEKRCHDLPLPRRTLAPQHFYRCPSCELKLERVRPLRRKSACLVCCRKHAEGRYDERFRFVKIASNG